MVQVSSGPTGWGSGENPEVVVKMLPGGPCMAVAEVSIVGHSYRRGGLLRCMDGRANPRLDRQMFGVAAYLFVYLFIHLAVF